MNVSFFEKTNVSVDEMPDVVRRSVLSLTETEKKVNMALEKAERAREAAIANGSGKVGLLLGHKKNIESINRTICEISDATGELAASQTIILDYMKKLSEVTRFLFNIGVSNIAANRAVVRELEKQLKNAANGQLSPLARDELKATISQLKAQQDFMSKQDQTYSELKILKVGLDKSSRELKSVQQQTQLELGALERKVTQNSSELAYEQQQTQVELKELEGRLTQSSSELAQGQQQTQVELKELEGRLTRSSSELAYGQQQTRSDLFKVKDELMEKNRHLLEQLNELMSSGREHSNLIACISRTLDSHNASIEEFTKYNNQQDDCINFLYDNIRIMDISVKNIAFALTNINSRTDIISKFISELESYVTFLYSREKALDVRIKAVEKELCGSIDAVKALTHINKKLNEMERRIKEQSAEIDELKAYNDKQDELINHLCRGGSVVPKL